MTTATRRSEAGHLLDRRMREARAAGRPALVAYSVAGYPDRGSAVAVLGALAEHADVLEIGMPYSDPVLDGPVIQQAAARALGAGFRTDDLIDTVCELRDAPAALMVMSYWNPVLAYGPQRFADRLAAAGGAGVILPDLPIEEAEPWLRAASDAGLSTAFVVAPTASDLRLATICAVAGGFVYAPGGAGVTGHRTGLSSQLPNFVERLRSITPLPIAVGIGVSDTVQAAVAGNLADGVIVGSAFLRLLGKHDGAAGIRACSKFAAELANVLRHGSNPVQL